MRRLLIGCVLGLLLLGSAKELTAQNAEGAIKQVLTDQVSAWNRGDISAFMQGYENSPETTFIGKTMRQGWQQVMDRYKTSYSTKDAMGTLDFSDLKIRMLGTDYAVATGKYHLARSAAGGGGCLRGIFAGVGEVGCRVEDYFGSHELMNKP